MLGTFPELLPDELLYSGFARHQATFGYLVGTLKKSLFSTVNVTATIDLPGHLGAFVSRLPSADVYSVDYLIRNHTMLPYYEPFVPASRASLAREAMCSNRIRGVHFYLNATHSTLPNPPFLRFCKLCAEENQRAYGVAYWHRTHQAPGVLMCPTHKTGLVNSSIERSLRKERGRYYMLSNEVMAASSAISVPESEERHLLQIAANTSFTLNESAVVGDLQRLHERYRYFLNLRGWIGKSGRIQAQGLEEAFVEFYSEAFLEALKTPVLNAGTGDSWVARLFQLPDRAHPPLRHFLAMGFLGYSAAEVYTGLREVGKEDADSEEIPSGMRGAVYSSPCRNPFCDRYDKEKVRATNAPEGAPRKVTVKCPECGFAYDFDANCPRIYAIRNVGPRWEAHVRQMIAEGDRTKCQIAEAAEISPDTFDRVLARSNVATPDWAGPNKGVPWSDEARQ